MAILAWMPIPLTQGLYALVDGENFERLSMHKWSAHKSYNTYYAVRAIKRKGKQKLIRMHREILQLLEDVQTDHRNGCGLDNRRINLRPTTNQQNQWNRRPQYKTSKYKGVFLRKENGKWRAKIQFRGKGIHLGCFDNEIDAARTYDKAAKELFGEFARTNF